MIETVRQRFPLNVMYWTFREDGTFEVIDGLQRTISICQYVNANALQQYFRAVVDWGESTFRPTKERKKIMKGVEWGPLYDDFKDEIYDFKLLDNEVARLVKDDDVTNKKGIYPYILTGDERNLSIRAFTYNQKIKAYERQLGICPICKQHFELVQMEADHITPWCEGGPTIDTNCQMLCRDCNRRKLDK